MPITDSSLASTLTAAVAALRDQSLDRTLKIVGHRRGSIVETTSGLAVDFASNDYLGLASDSRLADAAIRALKEHGTGAAASRLISGNNPEHVALESELARFFDAECAVAFSSGYAANIGIIPALVGRNDAIFSDELNHASLIDGCRLSRAATHIYPHGDAAALERLLAEHRDSAAHALIVTDGIFSMDGDAAPLAAVVDLARRFDAWTYVDDAHAVGVVGEAGRGTASAAGVHGEIDVTVGTLGKSFGAAGAFAYGSPALCTYLINKVRSFIFSTGMMPAQAAAARAGVAVARAEPERMARVGANARRLRELLGEQGMACLGEVSAHVIPLIIGDAAATIALGESLARDGYLVGAVRPPTVREGTSRLRITVSAAHEDEQLVGLAGALAR